MKGIAITEGIDNFFQKNQFFSKSLFQHLNMFFVLKKKIK